MGQVLGDAVGWILEHPGWVAAGVVAWVALSIGLALVAGPVIGAAEWDGGDDR